MVSVKIKYIFILFIFPVFIFKLLFEKIFISEFAHGYALTLAFVFDFITMR
ncbi:membrane protein [Salmonella enterica]|nr:membrane protein [Salmonella enterica]